MALGSAILFTFVYIEKIRGRDGKMEESKERMIKRHKKRHQFRKYEGQGQKKG